MSQVSAIRCILGAMQQSPSEWEILSERAAEMFTPAAPIDHVDFFAGRWGQLTAIKDAVVTKGQHAVLFGERGVGKTSLASVVGALLQVLKVKIPLVVRQNCGKLDTYGTVWKRALAQVVMSLERKTIGFDVATAKQVASLAERVSSNPGPDEVVALLRTIPGRLVFVFDEFDQLPDRAATKPFADTIKALSDYAVESTVVLVGVGDNVGALLESHTSIDRALIQIAVPRMTFDELAEILSKVAVKLGISFEPIAAQRIVDFSQGLPHYVHLLGLHSTRAATSRQSRVVTESDVAHGVAVAVSKVPQSTLEAYQNAVDSPQRDALFRHVLLACALTEMDDRGSFAPGDIRPALNTITGRELDIPAFAPHLNKFASEDRGEILQKLGQERRFRYRFRNPLMQPYVVMRGLADQLLRHDQIDTLRGRNEAS